MERPKLRKVKFSLIPEVEQFVKETGRSEILNQDEEWDQPDEIDNIEQSIIVYTKNLLKRKSDELAILKSFYRKIEPFYNYIQNFMTCKKGCGCCCYIHVDVTQLDVAFINKKYKLDFTGENFFRDCMDHGNEHIKCPLLKDNSCSIYENRPFVCRKYYYLPDEDGICSGVKDFGTKNDSKNVSFIFSPNIEYAYSLINRRFCERKKILDYPIDLKKCYKDCEK